MRKYITLFLLLMCLHLGAHSQKWQLYSDSIMRIISVKFNKEDLQKASQFLQLADYDLEQVNVIKDTIYADYLYRKGYVKINLGEFAPEIFEESLAIWNRSFNKNYLKIAKIHYFLAVSYYSNLNYAKAYSHYENCYLINNTYQLPKSPYFFNSLYLLSAIDFNVNKDLKKAKKFAKEYIELNKEIAILNYDFHYAYAYRWIEDNQTYVNVLLEFNKNYLAGKQDNPYLYFRINYELFTCYYHLDDVKEIINYGEKSVKLYENSGIDDEKYLQDLYPKLVWAFSEIKDDINRVKYENLNDRYAKTQNVPEYYNELDKSYRKEDIKNYINIFSEYENNFRTQKDYNSLFELYNFFLMRKLGQSVIFTDEDILNRIDQIKSQRNFLSQVNQIKFDLYLANFYLSNKQFNQSLDICNKYLNVDDVELKLAFYTNKYWCEYQLNDSERAKKTAFKAYSIANEFYGYSDPRILPFLIHILNLDVLANDPNSTRIATKTLKILYENKLENTSGASRTWATLGKYAMFNGNYLDAKIYLEKSLSIQEANKYIESPNDYFFCLDNLIHISMKELNYDNAISYANKMLLFFESEPDLDKNILGKLQLILGNIDMIQMNYKEAIIHYEKGFSILGEKESKKNKFNYIICKYLLENNIPDIISELEIFQQDNGDIIHVSNIIYLLKYNSGDLDGARKQLVDKVDKLISENNIYFQLLSDYERENLYKKFSDQFELLNTYLLDNDSKFLSQYINFRFYSKSLLFSNSFKSSLLLVDEKNKDLYAEFKNNTIQINKAIENRSEDLKSIEELKNKNREIEKFLTVNSMPLPVPSLKDLNNKLKQDDAYVEIIRINKQSKNDPNIGIDIIKMFTDSIFYGAIIIRKDKAPKFVLINDDDQLENHCSEHFKSQIKSRQLDTISYHRLFEAIESELNNVSKIYFVSDGAYNSINIEAIYNPVKRKYLIDYLKVQQVQNVRSITEEKKEFKVTSDTKASLFGNPDFNLDIKDNIISEYVSVTDLDSTLLSEIRGGTNITRLAGTEKEISTLSSILKLAQCSVDLYSGHLATEDNLKKVLSPDILHIATHGYFLKNDDASKTKLSISELFNDNYAGDPFLKSGLLFAGAQNTLNGKQLDGTNNGILTAEEAKSLDLKDTKLVVLSACETGLGDNLVGEGVIGLPRAFMIAGAESVIMSLWSVSDEKTQQLMTIFYTNWVKHDMSKEDAFYKAKMEMKQLHPQPYYWAGFILTD